MDEAMMGNFMVLALQISKTVPGKIKRQTSPPHTRILDYSAQYRQSRDRGRTVHEGLRTFNG
jgi:hypothetical protein